MTAAREHFVITKGTAKRIAVSIYIYLAMLKRGRQ